MVEVENSEVEQMLHLETSYDEYKLGDYGIETCIDYYTELDSHKKVAPETVVDKLFQSLKGKEIIPNEVNTYSYEIPGCERLKNKKGEINNKISHKVILQYSVEK